MLADLPDLPDLADLPDLLDLADLADLAEVVGASAPQNLPPHAHDGQDDVSCNK